MLAHSLSGTGDRERAVPAGDQPLSPALTVRPEPQASTFQPSLREQALLLAGLRIPVMRILPLVSLSVVCAGRVFRGRAVGWHRVLVGARALSVVVCITLVG